MREMYFMFNVFVWLIYKLGGNHNSLVFDLTETPLYHIKLLLNKDASKKISVV